ncbi:MAG TPA: galactose-1-phosphate uridylyltransferase [Deinococcales bacterium]|nr:galactose-1-phosphate uridylyltransferase [Deinococcales bacterium]
MHRRDLTKLDGRELHLYSRRPIPDDIAATSPSDEPVDANPHMRFHPLRGEWVTYAAYRQNRTFLPPPEYNPLAPTTSPDFPTELPQGDYDAAVFQNRFPSLTLDAHDPPEEIVPTQPGTGACEVVVFTKDPKGSLGGLPMDHLQLVVDVWADRYTELGSDPRIQYVMPFENRGVEMGVTLYHPHGQIYAYNHVPPIPARELEQQRAHFDATGRGLLADLIQAELKDGQRIIYQGPHVVAFVPACARYTYEVWLAPVRPAPSIADLNAEEREDFARALKTVLLKYDHLFANRPVFPYLMVCHQAPTDGQPHPEAHLHLEFYPPYRTPDRLKYLAGTELGAGMFASDALPEAKARELQAVEVTF